MNIIQATTFIFIFTSLITACTQDITNDISYDVQPEIPMYSQLLLKGEIIKVKDSIVVQNHPEFTQIIEMSFDSNRNLSYYAINYNECGTTFDLTHRLYDRIKYSYAFFRFSDKWKSTNSTSIEAIKVYPEKSKEDSLKLDYSWNEDGLFTEVRGYRNNKLIGIEKIIDNNGNLVDSNESDFEIEKYLYDKNGFPRYEFHLGEYLSLTTFFDFKKLDIYNNALEITVTSVSGTYTIHRIITYV